MARMPAVFIGHGSPMNALESNRYTLAWRKFGKTAPKPRALLVVSAHWYLGATAVTAMARPRTIYDMYGFPPQLYAVQYPAPGSPEVAQEVAETVKPTWIGLDQDQWGLDHGTWSVLTHMYPAADVPVVQLSINALKPLEYHVDLATRLRPLRDKGILIVGSGNVVHNLRMIDWSAVDDGFDWSHRFDDSVREELDREPIEILRVTSHGDYGKAVPTPDHFIPLLYLAGLASDDEPVHDFVRGHSLGSISMTCYTAGTDLSSESQGAGAAGLPGGVPADNTNT
jgi:4,5-DOPA dioxygenase extradiol